MPHRGNVMSPLKNAVISMLTTNFIVFNKWSFLYKFYLLLRITLFISLSKILIFAKEKQELNVLILFT
jgi:hypothetical protein